MIEAPTWNCRIQSDGYPPGLEKDPFHDWWGCSVILSLDQSTTIYNEVVLDCDMTEAEMVENTFTTILIYILTGHSYYVSYQTTHPHCLTGLIVKSRNGDAERVGYFELQRGTVQNPSAGTWVDLEGRRQLRLLQSAQRRKICLV